MRPLMRAIFVAAVAAWITGVAFVLAGNRYLGAAIGVPAAFVLLYYAWRRGATWLPDGGGGP